MQMVADKAGVSLMTVSNVVNGRSDQVRDETRKMVEGIIKELGYVPNSAARALASATQLRIGLLHVAAEHGFLSSLLIGAMTASSRVGAQILLRSYPHLDKLRDREGVEKGIRTELQILVKNGADALLVPAPLCALIDTADLITSLGVPVMAIAPGAELAHIPCVRVDDFSAARDMTRYLIAAGHQRIAFVRAPRGTLVHHSRYEGFRAAMAEAKLPVGRGMVQTGTFFYDCGVAVTQKLLALEQRPTAVFASNDDMAVGIIGALHRVGLNVPNDMSVAGFDDSSLAVHVWPTLTTIRQPVADIADRAVVELARQLRGDDDDQGDQPRTLFLPYALIERESVKTL